MARKDAKRKVFFYRLLDTEGKPVDRPKICDGITKLKGKNRYYDDGGLITRASVYKDTAPQCIRFYRIRRDELPAKDDGQGGHEDLQLLAREGLAEAIHMCLFKNGIVGIEAFFYGPRASRFPLFLGDKLKLTCELRPLIRHDVLDRALKFKDIRLLRIKLDAAAGQEAAKATSLDGLMKTVNNFNTGSYADLVLRSEGGDQSFTRRVRRLIKRIKDEKTETEFFDKLEIEGKPDPDSPVAPLDLLAEQVYRTVEIRYRAQRTRELDADAAFSAIQKAYKDVKQHLSKDALGES